MTGENAGGAPARPEGTDLDVRHESFAIERRLDATAASVFAAFGDDSIRRRWFRLPGSGAISRHEFRVGGGTGALEIPVVS